MMTRILLSMNASRVGPSGNGKACDRTELATPVRVETGTGGRLGAGGWA